MKNSKNIFSISVLYANPLKENTITHTHKSYFMLLFLSIYVSLLCVSSIPKIKDRLYSKEIDIIPFYFMDKTPV